MKTIFLSIAVILGVLLPNNSFSQTKTKKEPHVSASKMNVFYAGLDNPVEITIQGVPDPSLTVTMSRGTIKRVGDGKYIAQVKGTENVKVLISSNKVFLGSREFRVKSIPTPKAYCMGVSGRKIKKSALMASLGVYAKLENFDFDVKFRIISFEVSVMVDNHAKTARSTGSKFTKEQKSIILNEKRRKRVIIERIKAVGPDGVVRRLSPILYTTD